MTSLNINYEDALNAYSVSLSKVDYLKIFLSKSISYTEVDEDLRKLGVERPKFSKKNLESLSEFYDAALRYLSGETIRTVVEGTSFSKTFLQTIFQWCGILRNKSDAAIVAIEKDRLKVKGTQKFYGYLCKGKKITLRSKFELAYIQMISSLNNVASVEYESLKIEYTIDGKVRNYVPDFKIVYDDGKVEIAEVKPLEAIDLPQNVVKSEYAIKFCESRGWSYKYITQNDIDWSRFPNWEDENILWFDKPPKKEVKPREKRKVEEKSYSHFITKIKSGEYTYKNHPRVREDITYEKIMSYINQNPANSISISDICRELSTSRNAIACRVVNDSEFKNFKEWETFYLKEISDTEHDLLKLKFKELGIKDFDVPTLEEVKEYLKSLGRKCMIVDLSKFKGWPMSRVYRYYNDVLGVEPHAYIKEINSEIGY